MAGVENLDAAAALWTNVDAPTAQRGLAGRAIGLLGELGPEWIFPVDEVDDHEPLSRTYSRACRVSVRRSLAKPDITHREEAEAKMAELGVRSVDDAIALLLDPSANEQDRESAAVILRGLRDRRAMLPLIEVLAEGHKTIAWLCMSAITHIGSRRGARRLIGIARSSDSLTARQEAIYTLWMIGETRSERLFIQLSAAVDTEEEYTRDMATEALRNTWRSPRSQRAIAARLFDPSISVRYSALCAVIEVNERTLPCLREALQAKLDDPARLDEDRVVAELAAELLAREACRS
jgi:HEAT repeat protein